MLIGDVNGDSRSDLLVQQGRNELRVFLGAPGPDLFARRPQKVAVAMPNEEYMWTSKDGPPHAPPVHATRCSRGPETTAGTEPHRVTMLIAR